MYKESGRVSGGVRVCVQCAQLYLVPGIKSEKRMKTSHIGHGKAFFKMEYIVCKDNTRFYNAQSELNIQKHMVWSM